MRIPSRCPLPVLRLDDAPGQWVFDRSRALAAAAPEGARGLVAVVISTSGPHDTQDQASLAARCRCAAAPARRAMAAARLVARDRRAPGDVRVHAGLRSRPAAGKVAPGLYLAGDYTDPELPATLEAATRSGVAAARAVLADHNIAAGHDAH